MKKCPICDGNNEDNAKRCEYCDYDLTTEMEAHDDSIDKIGNGRYDTDMELSNKKTSADTIHDKIAAYYEDEDRKHESNDVLTENMPVEPGGRSNPIIPFLVAMIILLGVGITLLLISNIKKDSGQIGSKNNNAAGNINPVVSETEQVVTGLAVKTDNGKVMTSEETRTNADKTPSKEEITDKEKFVNFIIENESLWLDQLRNSSMNSNNDECWFQDCDMDGFPEFICGDDVLGNKGFSHFYILKYNNGSALYDFNTGNSSSQGGSSEFDLLLYRRGDKFVYVHEYSGTTFREEHGLIEYSGNWITDNSYDSVMHCIANDNDSFDFDGLSRDEYIDEFYNYYSNMTPYSVSIKAVPCSRNSDYDNYSESEKRNKLLESFDAWKYSESSHSAVTAPLSDFIVKLIEKRENDNSQKTNSVNTNSRDSAERGGGIYGDYDKAYLTSDMVYYEDAYIGYVDISGGVLNFRSAPSTGSDVLLTLAKDQSIFVQYEGKDWAFGYVNYNNSKYFGYASKQYIRREYRDYQTPYEELNK